MLSSQEERKVPSKKKGFAKLEEEAYEQRERMAQSFLEPEGKFYPRATNPAIRASSCSEDAFLGFLKFGNEKRGPIIGGTSFERWEKKQEAERRFMEEEWAKNSKHMEEVVEEEGEPSTSDEQRPEVSWAEGERNWAKRRRLEEEEEEYEEEEEDEEMEEDSDSEEGRIDEDQEEESLDKRIEEDASDPIEGRMGREKESPARGLEEEEVEEGEKEDEEEEEALEFVERGNEEERDEAVSADVIRENEDGEGDVEQNKGGKEEGNRKNGRERTVNEDHRFENSLHFLLQAPEKRITNETIELGLRGEIGVKRPEFPILEDMPTTKRDVPGCASFPSASSSQLNQQKEMDSESVAPVDEIDEEEIRISDNPDPTDSNLQLEEEDVDLDLGASSSSPLPAPAPDHAPTSNDVVAPIESQSSTSPSSTQAPVPETLSQDLPQEEESSLTQEEEEEYERTLQENRCRTSYSRSPTPDNFEGSSIEEEEPFGPGQDAQKESNQSEDLTESIIPSSTHSAPFQAPPASEHSTTSSLNPEEPRESSTHVQDEMQQFEPSTSPLPSSSSQAPADNSIILNSSQENPSTSSQAKEDASSSSFTSQPTNVVPNQLKGSNLSLDKEKEPSAPAHQKEKESQASMASSSSQPVVVQDQCGKSNLKTEVRASSSSSSSQVMENEVEMEDLDESSQFLGGSVTPDSTRGEYNRLLAAVEAPAATFQMPLVDENGEFLVEPVAKPILEPQSKILLLPDGKNWDFFEWSTQDLINWIKKFKFEHDLEPLISYFNENKISGAVLESIIQRTHLSKVSEGAFLYFVHEARRVINKYNQQSYAQEKTEYEKKKAEILAKRRNSIIFK